MGQAEADLAVHAVTHNIALGCKRCQRALCVQMFRRHLNGHTEGSRVHERTFCSWQLPPLWYIVWCRQADDGAASKGGLALALPAGPFVVQLTVSAPVGGLTQPRVKAAEAAAGQHGFVTEIGVEGASGRAWARGPKVVALLSDQLVFVFPTEPGESPSFALMSEVLQDMLRVLMLQDGESRYPFVLQVWGQLSAPQDVMTYSRRTLARLPLEGERPGGNSVLGAGIRVFLQGDEGSIWELKVEPFLRDTRKLHVEMICSNGPTDPHEIVPRSQILWERFCTSWIDWGVSRFFQGVEEVPES